MRSENGKSRSFQKYTGIFAISSKGVIGYEIYKVLLVTKWWIFRINLFL